MSKILFQAGRFLCHSKLNVSYRSQREIRVNLSGTIAVLLLYVSRVKLKILTMLPTTRYRQY